MINLEEYQQLKRKSEKAKSDVARAEGALEQQMKKLKDDFNCDSIKEAEELLTQFENEEKYAEEQYEKELSVFKDKWVVTTSDNLAPNRQFQSLLEAEKKRAKEFEENL